MLSLVSWLCMYRYHPLCRAGFRAGAALLNMPPLSQEKKSSKYLYGFFLFLTKFAALGPGLTGLDVNTALPPWIHFYDPPDLKFFILFSQIAYAQMCMKSCCRLFTIIF